MMFLLSRLGPVIALIVGLIGSLFIGSLLGSEDYELVIFIFAVVTGLGWMIAAGDRWWLPMAFGVGLGGVFYVPFKVYPHEITLAACGVALIPRLFLKRAAIREGRTRAPLPVLLLVAYLLAHLTVSIYTYGGQSGAGSIARSYMHALWGPVFGLAFYWYGSTKHLRAGFALLYAALLIRITFGLVNIYQGAVLFVPGINYALDEQDMRNSSNLLMIAASLACVFGRSLPLRICHGFLAFASSIAWLTLGGSRGQLVITLFFGVVLALIFRWRGLLVTLGVGGTLLVTILNVAPFVIDPLPYQTQRALTVLMFSSRDELEIQSDVRGSSSFRQALWDEAVKRWTESPRTITVGTGIKPWDESTTAGVASFEMEMFSLGVRHGADVGVYETGLWSMLAVTGLVGLTLFYVSFFAVFTRLVRALRTLPLEGVGKIFAAWSAAALASYFCLSFVGGLFPSFEFLLAFIALGYADAVRAAQRAEEKVPQQASAPPAPQPRALVPAGVRG